MNLNRNFSPILPHRNRQAPQLARGHHSEEAGSALFALLGQQCVAAAMAAPDKVMSGAALLLSRPLPCHPPLPSRTYLYILLAA